MSKKHTSLLVEIHAQIRDGNLHHARRIINELSEVRLTRADRLELAYLCRRSFLPDKAIELLHRIVRSESRGTNAPTEEERAEYGMALAELADSREALSILSTIDIQRLPRIFLGLTLAYFRSWEWDTALPIIQRFLARPKITQAEKLNATFCLGAALMHGFEDYGPSQKILEESLRETKKHDFPELHRDTQMMLAQNLYYQRDFKAAERLLDQIPLGTSREPEQTFALTIAQLRASIQIQTSRDKAAGLRALHEIRGKFESLHRSFKVRSCDFAEIETTGNQELLTHMYFGTPLPGAARKFRRFFKLNPADLPATYEWRLPSKKSHAGRLSVLNGVNSYTRANLKAGQVPQRLLQALSLDFYKAPNTPELHERMYPDEHFNPNTSAIQVRQAIWRLRQWFEAHRVPLQIAERRGAYYLAATSPLAIAVPRPALGDSPHTTGPSARCADVLRELKTKFAAREFSANDAAKILQISPRSTLNYLKEALAHHQVEQIGNGPRTRYRAVKTES